MHAAKLGAAMQRRKHLAGIEQALGVERAFQPLLLALLFFARCRLASHRFQSFGTAEPFGKISHASPAAKKANSAVSFLQRSAGN